MRASCALGWQRSLEEAPWQSRRAPDVGPAPRRPEARPMGKKRAQSDRRLQREAEERRPRSKQGRSKAQGAAQLGERNHPESPLPRQHLPKPGMRTRSEAETGVPGRGIPRFGQARGHGGPDHGRRFRHRPVGRGAVRARGRRPGDRLPERGRGRGGDPAGGGGRGTAGAAHPGRRHRLGLLSGCRWKRRCASWADWTSW
jgi:hypothetical protein